MDSCNNSPPNFQSIDRTDQPVCRYKSLALNIDWRIPQTAVWWISCQRNLQAENSRGTLHREQVLHILPITYSGWRRSFTVLKEHNWTAESHTKLLGQNREHFFRFCKRNTSQTKQKVQNHIGAIILPFFGLSYSIIFIFIFVFQCVTMCPNVDFMIKAQSDEITLRSVMFE